MDRKNISIPTANDSFDALLTAADSAARPGLLLVPEILGLNPQAQELADLYTEEGYLVLVPDLFRKTGNSTEAASGHERQLNIDRPIADAAAAASALRANSACDGKVAAIGWRLGGTIACCVAARLPLDAVVAYCPPALDRHLDTLKSITCPVGFHFAAEDALVEAEARASVKQALATKDDAEVYVYPGAGRDFSDGRGNGLRGAASLAHSRTMSLLRRAIGPRYDLEALWERHLEGEFVTCDADATINTMVARPYVNHVPTMIGGLGREQLHRYYKHYLIPQARGGRMIPLSRTVGVDRVVDEFVACFRHDTPNDTLLPGIKPTGRYVELPMVAIVQFRGDKLCAEHLYWDQASLLVQVGLLDPTQYPVTGAEAAASVQDETVPLNTLRAAAWWKKSEGRCRT
jgi:carboxymethylenebutenolidase